MSDRESGRNSRRSPRRSRCDDQGTRSRRSSRSCRDPRASRTRPSRSRSRRDYRTSRTRPSHSRSKHRSRSIGSTRRELTRKREQVRSLENEVLDGLKTGNVALKNIHEVLNIDEIEKIMDETKEGIEKQREIDDLISGQLTEEDEEAVEAELEAILDVSDQLPDVPKERLPDIQEETPEKPQKEKQGTKKIAVEA